MIREVELNLLVPSPELLVRLASGERPLGVRAGPPRIRVLRETYFDTRDQALRHRGMTCKLRQGEGEEPSVVVTIGEGPDSEGITSRSRLTASAVGLGVFETLRRDSEPGDQLRKYVNLEDLRPHVALDIQRLGRTLRTHLLRRPVLHLYFDRITVQAGRSTSVFHEIRVRRRRKGGPHIREIAQLLRDRYDLFPDGLTTLQRAYRILAVDGRGGGPELSPYGLSLGLALFREGRLGLLERGGALCLPSFRGSGEDAARALLADLTGQEELELVRLGTTEPREKRPVVEVWTGEAPSEEELSSRTQRPLSYHPWHDLLEQLGAEAFRDPNLLPALLLLTRRRLPGQLRWIPEVPPPGMQKDPSSGSLQDGMARDPVPPQVQAVSDLFPQLRRLEAGEGTLEDHLAAASRLSSALDRIILEEIRGLKERIISGDPPGADPSPAQLLDLLSVKLRALTDRLHRVVNRELLPALEARRVHLRKWSGLMYEDRRSLLEAFSRHHLPSMKVVPDWGPAFVPEMPPVGCAIGLAVKAKGSNSIRLFHLVLADDTPSFIRVSGSTVFLPLEEVVRGYLFSEFPALERAETHLFRFRTAEITVRETLPNPRLAEDPLLEMGIRDRPELLPAPLIVPGTTVPEPAPEGDSGPPVASPLRDPGIETTITRETRQSVVVMVLVHPEMPEAFRSQLLRALERQVSRERPLIGWSDLFTASGPMNLDGLPDLLEGEAEFTGLPDQDPRRAPPP